jgi:6-phosphogluconolactonase
MDEGMLVYVGTYTHGPSKGIYVYRLDPSSGDLRFVSVTEAGGNPTFLALDPAQRHLYAANEVGEYGGQHSGAVSAFSLSPDTGELTYLNRQATGGTGPCHLSVDRTGQFVLVANYSGGSVSMLPLEADGSLGEATDFVQHRGSSVDPKRQEGPHAHSITPDPANRYAFAADLGLDKIMVYKLDLSEGKLLPNDTPWVQVHAGAGPRHFAFHPNGKYAYVINELDSTLIAYAYDAALGTLEAVQTVTTLPKGYSGTNYCADVHVHPSGKYLYGSNRGHDSIAIYALDESTGMVSPRGHTSTQGEWPRNFALDPTATYLLAANQNSDTVVTFRIDPGTGDLEPTGHVTEVPAPVCVKILPAP